MVELVLFYIFGLITIISAVMVVLSKNPVRAVLSLVVTFVSAACIWMLLEVEFLSLALIVIYVGAVMVLFLFVVMMLNIEWATRRASFVPYWPLGLVVAVLLVSMLSIWLGPAHFGLKNFPAPVAEPQSYSNIKALGMLLYTQYLYPFELAAVLLLAAMIAVIALVYRPGSPDAKRQKPGFQVRVEAQDRFKLFDLRNQKASPNSNSNKYSNDLNSSSALINKGDAV